MRSTQASWGRSRSYVSTEVADQAPTVSDRLLGAVWGHLVGDALGVPYEFRSPADVGPVHWGAVGTHGQQPGTWSDDGALMLALLDSLLTSGFDVEDQGRRALAWYDGNVYSPAPVFDVGITTSRALERLRAGATAALAGGAAESDNGNGSLMRILPVAIAEPGLSKRVLVERAALASCLTHRHPRAQLTCAVYCVIASQLLFGEQDIRDLPQRSISDIATVAAPELTVEVATLRDYKQRTGGGYVLDTFWSAWSAFESATSYRQAVEAAIRFGNDTDTTASVAGGLAGLHWGVQSIPDEWLRGMRGRQIVQPLTDRLLDAWRTSPHPSNPISAP